ncbi:MAG: transcriptional regulator [Clostridiales bacterium]|nr:transcriptional regulator [Clostridiales bacterium]
MDGIIPLVAFTGAGISKQSGIPTFEELDNRHLLTRGFCMGHPKEFYDNLLMMERSIRDAQPNAAHLALAEKQIPIITMNIDGLHHKAGSQRVVEIHGSLRKVHCRRCKQDYPFRQIEEGCTCPICGKVFDHDVVLYDDPLPLLSVAQRMVAQAKELLVVGTSFYTSTSSFVVEYARSYGTRVTIINEDAVKNVPIYLTRF